MWSRMVCFGSTCPATLQLSALGSLPGIYIKGISSRPPFFYHLHRVTRPARKEWGGALRLLARSGTKVLYLGKDEIKTLANWMVGILSPCLYQVRTQSFASISRLLGD
ncbi:hypothetical protein VPH35_114499 [Triticum aestivum]|uniref:Uncharacterized protein n=1 Tax=Aegilops tauschii subsp. strangulata TaxID=200361 RepID=A0A453MQX9_AEGTS